MSHFLVFIALAFFFWGGAGASASNGQDRCLAQYLFDYSEHFAPHWYEREFKLKSDPSVVFRIRGFLDNQVLYLDVRARAPGGKRLEGFVGSQVLDQVMQHFKEHHIKAIAGEWHSHSDNLIQFNQYQSAGLNEVEAALATWTGRQAVRYGYTRARIIHTQGGMGYFTSVKVLFEKP